MSEVQMTMEAMVSKRVTWIRNSVFTCAVIFAAGTAFPGEQPLDQDAELLRGELLEVSAGDLEAAMAVYRSLLDRDTTPESIRARALLYLARCHRKRGELESARQLLEELIRKHEKETAIIAPARQFLGELTRGTAESPRFNWLAEMERNPEIQARVFDFAMELIAPGSEAGQRAETQLRALGGIAVPTLERVITNSRNPRHRQYIALVLVETGRYAHLETLLANPIDGGWLGYYLARFSRSVRRLDADSRERFLQALARAPVANPQDEPYHALLRLAAGDHRQIHADLPRLYQLRDYTLKERRVTFGVSELVARLLEDDAGAHAVAASLESASTSRGFLRWLELLVERRIDLVTPAHLNAVSGAHREGFTSLVNRLLEKRSVDLLHQLAGGELGREVAKLTLATDAELATVDVARILRAAGEIVALQQLAERDDAAIGEFVKVLEDRETHAPEFRGAARASRSPRNGARRRLARRPRRGGDPSWVPSPYYARAMADRLDSTDPIVLGIALEALALAPMGAGPAIVPELERLIRNPPDPRVAEIALYALIARAVTRPETGPDTVRLADRFYRARQSLKPDDAYHASPLTNREVGNLKIDSWPVRPGREPFDLAGNMWRQLFEWLSPDAIQMFYRNLLPFFEQGDAIALHEAWVRDVGGRNPQYAWEPEVMREFLAALERLEAPASRVAVLSVLAAPYVRRKWEAAMASSPSFVRYLKEFIRDRSLPTKSRSVALSLAMNLPHDGTWGAFTGLDWPAFLASADPLAPHAIEIEVVSDAFSALAADERETVARAALQSPHPPVRAWGIERIGVDAADFAEVLRTGLRSPEPAERHAAAERVMNLQTAVAVPLLIEIVRHGDIEYQVRAIDSLKFLASPEGLKPLVELLDHPNFGLRRSALEALEEIRGTLEKRKEWKETVKGVSSETGN